MTSPLRRPARTTATLLISVLALVAASLGPALAAPVTVSYKCGSPDISGSLNIDLTLESTAPAKVYVGKSSSPTMVVSATIPALIVGLASSNNVKSASATGTLTVNVNGKPSPRPLVFPRTNIPQGFQAMDVTIRVPLAKLAPTSVGSVTYTPGPVAVTLEGYSNNVEDAQPGDSVGTASGDCTTTSTQTLDKVTFVKSPTTTSGALASVPGKKVRATATVTSTSGVAPVGTVTAKVYRGTKLLLTRTSALAGGRSAAVFPKPAKKGTYKVVLSYGGSKALLGSSSARTFTVR